MTTSRVMKRFAPLYIISILADIYICLFEVADWFYRNATKFNLVAEAIVENALINDPRPTKKHPLRQFFPDLIDKTTLPDPLPRNLDDQVPQIFKDHKISGASLIDTVHTAINTIMCFDADTRRRWRFDDLVYYRLIVTTAVPWSLRSHYHIRDWWPVAAAAFLESVVILDYRQELLKTIVGHARQQLYDIVMKHVKGTLKRVKDGKESEYIKRWEWADKMETPEVLPALAEYLDDNPEAKYRKLMAQLRTRRDADAAITAIFRLEASRVYQDQIIEAKVPKKTSKGGQKVNLVGSVIKKKPFMAKEVHDATLALIHVSGSLRSFCFYFYLC